MIKEQIDPLLIVEDGTLEESNTESIPCCSNCGNPLYENKEERSPFKPSADVTDHCNVCFSYLVPIQLLESDK